MQGINVPGVGSGLDVKGLVNKLVKAEGAPEKSRLNRKEAELQANISALGNFRSAISDFQSSLDGLRKPEDLRKVTAQSSDENAIEVAASAEAEAGNYEVQVSQLAQAQRLTSQSFESELDPVGTGTLTFQFGRYDQNQGRFVPKADASVKTIKIEQANSSARGIVEAINRAQVGVRASLINDGTGSRIVLSGEGTGEDNAIRLLTEDDDGNNTDAAGLSVLRFDPVGDGRAANTEGGPAAGGGVSNLIETARAQNAELVIDGIDITSPSNNVGEAIKGLTLTLNDTTSGPVAINAELDQQAVAEAVHGFVKSYNELMGVIHSLTEVDQESGEAGPLAGDASIRGIAEQVRRVMSSAFGDVNQNVVSLSTMGIDTQRDGTLSVNDSELNRAIEQHLDEVIAVLAKSGSATDPLVRFDSAQDQTNAGSYDLYVTQTASRGTYRGERPQAAGPLVIAEGQNSFRVNVDGVNSDEIHLTPGRYETLNEVAAELQRVINADQALRDANAAVSVELDADGLTLLSNRFGSASGVSVAAAAPALGRIGLVTGQGSQGKDVHATLGRMPADGSGQLINGRGPAEGIQVRVMGGTEGPRGEVHFSRGVAEQLHGILQGYLDSDGMLAARQDGLKHRLEDIGDQRKRLARRLATTEDRLLKKYSTLDATIGKMKKTSQYLSNQLSKLPGANSKGVNHGNGG
jgi:flagellar hook-associated protein 2